MASRETWSRRAFIRAVGAGGVGSAGLLYARRSSALPNKSGAGGLAPPSNGSFLVPIIRKLKLDQKIQEMETVADEGVGTSDRAAKVAETASNASERLDALNASLGEIHGRIETAQGQIAAASDQIGSITGLSAIAITAIAIWVGLLHVLLISNSRRWIRGGTEPAPASAAEPLA